MQIKVNGKEIDIADGLTVAELVSERGLSADTIVVEHNSIILPREKWSESRLSAADKVEIIAFVGGG